MKNYGFLIVVSIILIIYTLANFYIYSHISRALPEGIFSTIIKTTVIIAAIAFFIGSFLSFRFTSRIGDTIYLIGTYWLAFMLYIIIFLVFFDIILLANMAFPFIPESINANMSQIKIYLFFFVAGFTTIVAILGTINMYTITTKHLQPVVHKNVNETESLKIAYVSDIHLGAIFRKSFAENIVRKINATQPDIVLVGGDLFDNNTLAVIKHDMLAPFKELKSKYGTYACTGNHEYISGIDKSATYIAANNIKLLRDEFVCIDDKFYIVGREDRMVLGATGKARKELSDILVNIDSSKPIILLDHEPQKLDDAIKNNVDLQLSGHTHNGQLWPFGWITRKIYGVSWGYFQNEKTHYYVSCGVGTWGPPMKTSATSELVVVEMKFNPTI